MPRAPPLAIATDDALALKLCAIASSDVSYYYVIFFIVRIFPNPIAIIKASAFDRFYALSFIIHQYSTVYYSMTR